MMRKKKRERGAKIIKNKKNIIHDQIKKIKNQIFKIIRDILINC